MPTTLRQALRDFTNWCEGDELLHYRFRPGSTVEIVGGRSEVVGWLTIQAPDSQSFGVGVIGGRLATQRSWYEGMDAWEAAGRPTDPARQPRLMGMRGIDRSLNADDALAVAFEDAVLALHASILDGTTRHGSPEREALADGIEGAIRAIIRAELSAAGVPDWLLGGEGMEGDEAPAPRF